jgi:hypothetical protein
MLCAQIFVYTGEASAAQDVAIRHISAITHINKFTWAESLWRHVELDIGHGLLIEYIPCNHQV